MTRVKLIVVADLADEDIPASEVEHYIRDTLPDLLYDYDTLQNYSIKSVKVYDVMEGA